MKPGCPLLLCGILLFPAFCRAQTECLWINAVTATDSPSGTTVPADQITVTDGGNDCQFRFQDHGVAYELRVTVRSAEGGGKSRAIDEAKCTSPKTPLPGLGNETVECSTDAHSSRGEQVVGRVRNKIFVIRVDTTARKGSSAVQEVIETLRDRATLAAEQVAGNLF